MKVLSEFARLFAAALLIIGQVQAGPSYPFVLDGRAKTPDGERGAELTVVCQPDSNGALAVKLTVPDATAAGQRFDFDAFEGPEPSAGKAKLTLLTVAGSQGKRELRTDTGGWYSAEREGAFVFATNQYKNFRKDIADLLGAVRGVSNFTWTQQGYADPALKIEASFAFDAGEAERLRDTVAGCLARAKKPRS